MNKRDVKTKKVGSGWLSIIYRIMGNIPTQTIYTVKCEEIHYVPVKHRTGRTTYNLFSFENYEEAVQYLNKAHKYTIDRHILDGFSIPSDLDNIIITDEEIHGINKILYQRKTKLIETNNSVNCQTKLFTFSVEEVELK